MTEKQIDNILDAQDAEYHRKLNYKLAWVIAVGLVVFKLASF
jgi:hypothetical protein